LPKKGKTGGAFCAGNKPLPTFILLNHTPDMRSVSTLAHEMGHGIHTELSSTQSVLYKGYSLAVAETASTFFEEVVFDDIFETLSGKEKIVALHDKINDSVSTIFRQIACFNFELALHNAIREKGFVSKEDISELLNEHMKSYLGPVMKMDERDGYFFVQWSHIRNHFYVYTYAFGEIVSKALYARYKKDPSFVKSIKRFLSAGSSKSPYQIFKDIGIDISNPKFFLDGLKEIESDIDRLEKLILEKNKK
jgi:oligoendopeptidase F